MVALQIEDIKIFMNKLFKDTTFDEFETISMDISQAFNFSIDGALNVSFLDLAEQELLEEQTYIKWSELKLKVFTLIKGNKTPSSMKIVFAISHKSKLNIIQKSNSSFKPDDIHGFYLNVYFDNNVLKAVTGTNYKFFSLDKSVEQYFDDSMLRFFSKHEIPVSNLNT